MKTTTIFLVILSLFFASCSKRLHPTISKSDSVRIEVIERIKDILRDTTIYVTIPQESHDAYSWDSIYRETSVAFAWAKTDTMGLIKLHLENKPVKLSAIVQIKDTKSTKDSIREVVKYEVKTEYVEKSLNWWQSLRLNLGGYALFGIVAYLAFILLKSFIKLR